MADIDEINVYSGSPINKNAVQEAIKRLEELTVNGHLEVLGDGNKTELTIGPADAYPASLHMSGENSVLETDDSPDLHLNKDQFFNQTLVYNQFTVLGNLISRDAAMGFEDENGDIQSLLYTGGSEDIHTLRTYSNVATILALRSKSGDPTADDREATLALIRTDDDTNVELLDFYCNGYHSDPAPLTVAYGIRIQKRGAGKYRPFVFDWRDGNGNIDTGFIIYSPDNQDGALVDWSIPHLFRDRVDHSGDFLDMRKQGEGTGTGEPKARNINFADGIISYDDGTGSISIDSDSTGIDSANRISAGVWRVVLSEGATSPDLVPSLLPAFPIWESGSSRDDVPQIGFEQDPDGDNPQELEIRFQISDETGTTTPVDPSYLAIKSTRMR